MGKGQLAGTPNWHKKQIDELTEKVNQNETDISELNTNITELNSNMNTTNSTVSTHTNQISTINNKLTDSGWIDVTPNTGTWEYFQYRKIRNRVTVRGRASSLTLKSGFGVGTLLTTLPSGYRPSKQIYMCGYSTAMVYSRMYVALGGGVGIDWSWNFYTNGMSEMDTWFWFETSYYVD